MASIRLVKYTKPYFGLVMLAIVLLFAQAMIDLSLPNYLSDIVDTGIQQEGVEDAIPMAIREGQMDRVLIFNQNLNNQTILNSYTLITNTSSNYLEYLDKYPILDTESVYVLNNLDDEEKDPLRLLLAKSLLKVQIVQTLMDDPDKLAIFSLALNITIPQNTDLFQILSMLPPQNLTVINSYFDQQFVVLGDELVIQSAIVAVRSEYEAIGINMDKIQNDYIFRIGGTMLILTILSVIATISVTYLSAKTASGLARDLRKYIFERVETFSLAEIDNFSTASLITRSTNDVTQIQMLIVMLIRMVFYAPIIGLGGILMAMDKGSSMWWIIAVAVAVLLSIIFTVVLIALPKFKRIQNLTDRLNLVARENLSGMLVIRAFNKEEFEEDRFNKANLDLTSVSLFINRLMAILMPLLMFIMNFIVVIIIWEGSNQVADFKMQVGDMMAFMQYTLLIVMSFLMMSIMLIMMPRALISADRILEVLDTKSTICDPDNPKTFPESFRGEIQFKNVSFQYPKAETDVLNNITFTAKPGETTAIIGSTGSGKTTIVNLIPRFYDPTQGEILIDGIRIQDVTQHDLREKIGYVSQKSVLFSGDIESNLLLGDINATEEEMTAAIKSAQATDFVFDKPEGLKTSISQGGTNISGGQKQRISIARALVKKPTIFIFDDSFSALDFKTDKKLRRELKERTGDSTILIVTQRVSTVLHAEQIIILENGKIVDKGTHTELMDQCEMYQEIVYSQIAKEELK